MRSKVKLPKRVKVAAFDFKIKRFSRNEGTEFNRFGHVNVVTKRIRIDPTCGRAQVLETLTHELLHAVYWAYGLEEGDKEERIVAAMATGWTQVMRDNPHIVKFYTKSLKAIQ